MMADILRLQGSISNRQSSPALLQAEAARTFQLARPASASGAIQFPSSLCILSIFAEWPEALRAGSPKAVGGCKSLLYDIRLKASPRTGLRRQGHRPALGTLR